MNVTKIDRHFATILRIRCFTSNNTLTNKQTQHLCNKSNIIQRNNLIDYFLTVEIQNVYLTYLLVNNFLSKQSEMSAKYDYNYAGHIHYIISITAILLLLLLVLFYLCHEVKPFSMITISKCSWYQWSLQR